MSVQTKIEPFHPMRVNQHLFPELVSCYRAIYAQGPWHEWKKCISCQHYWGKKDEQYLIQNNFTCIECSMPVVNYWPDGVVRNDILNDITENAICRIVIINEKVAGFCWGYPQTREQLSLKLSFDIWHDIESLWGQTDIIAYQAEMGIIEEFRGLGLAQILYASRLKEFLSQGLRIGIVRVREKPEPSKTYLWYYRKLRYEIVKQYPESDGRVILGTRLQSSD